MLEDGHSIGALRGREAVGDRDHRPALGNRREGALHRCLGGGVEARRLVQDDHGRIGQRDTGEPDELPLPEPNVFEPEVSPGRDS